MNLTKQMWNKTRLVNEYVKIGTNRIHATFKFGDNFEIEENCVIHEGCDVGNDVKMKSFVELRANTKIGNDVYVDSYFKSSGHNTIGNNVTLRFNATIAREVTVEDDCFISPNVMTIYSTHKGEKKGGIVIGKGSHIGTAVVIGPGVKIAPKTVIGAMSYVNKDITEEGTVWVGIPARQIGGILNG